jgi:hypothetical protein
MLRREFIAGLGAAAWPAAVEFIAGLGSAAVWPAMSRIARAQIYPTRPVP